MRVEFINKTNIWIILLILLVIPSFISLIRVGYFPMHDDLQAFRTHQMDKCIQDFQIPCRWVPDAGFQYGYPQFNYYPPSVYYFAEIFHLLGFQFIDSVKIIFALGFITSALAMFILTRSLFGNWAGFVAAILYTYIPYRALEVYVRGALSEFWALTFFPVIFWSTYQLIKTSKLKYLIWFSISTGLLLITHNLMSIIFLPLAAMWILIWIYLNKKWNILPQMILGGLLGLGLASFFTLPVALERQYAHLETLLGGYFDYRRHFVDLGQLFLTNNWGYGSSELGPGDDLNLSAGPIHFLATLLTFIFAILNYKKYKQVSLVIFTFTLLALINLFLVHQKSSFIWSKIAFLEWLQFPWRLLANNIFLVSFLSAALVFFIEKNIYKYLLGISLIVAALILHLSFFQPREWFMISDADKFSGSSWEKQLTISIFDYLPIYAKLPPINKAPDIPEVLKGKVEFISYKKGSNFQYGEVKVSEDATIRLPLFDYPGMEVKIDGRKINHINNDCRNQQFCLGLITFEIPSGTHKIEAKLTGTLIRKVGNLISVISLVFLGYLIFKNIYHVKK